MLISHGPGSFCREQIGEYDNPDNSNLSIEERNG